MKTVMKKCTAGLLCAALLAGVGAIPARAAETARPVKDETVYVFAAADGKPKKLTVSDWLQNTGKAPTLSDVSDLTQIENLKGDETFEKGSNGALVWKAGGNDIYYQGTSTGKVPVNITISYTLDGKAITPQQLAGKSGRVCIRFDYENTLRQQVQIKGRNETLCVPFAAVTAMMLPTNHFRNVTVTNGKMENLGNEIAVVGIALPGLQASLDLDPKDFEIPDYVEVTADATDFTLSGTVTVVSSSFLDNISTKDLNVQDLLDASHKLTDGTNQLIDGAGQLSQGLQTLLDKSSTLVKGIDQLMDGSTQLKTGADTLSGGAAQLQAGAAQLSQGLSALSANSESLRSGAGQVFNSLLSSAAAQLAAKGIEVSLSIGNYAQVLGGLIDQMTGGAHQAALEQVTAAVEAKRPEIQAAVQSAVEQQVQAQVTQTVTTAVRETVREAVNAQKDAITEQVIAQLLNMTPEKYAAAVEAGTISQEQQDAIQAAVEAAITAQIGEQMESEAIQAQITAKVEETMASGEIQEKIRQLTSEQTELQVQKAISEAMASEEIQNQLNAAAEGAKAITALKASLDSYNGFYQGVIAYTKGADQATAGAGDLKAGADTLKGGVDTLNSGISSLNQGIAVMKEQSPALVDGVGKLKDGSVSLKGGLDQLMRDGIRKIANLAEDDLDTLAERLRAGTNLAQAYTSFSGIHADMDGTVKFIYRTDAIESAQ